MKKELGDFLDDTTTAINFYKDDIISDEGLKKVLVKLLEALQIKEAGIRNKDITKIIKK